MRTVIENVQTNNLWCSDCGRDLKKGETVKFILHQGNMEKVFCEDCSSEDVLIKDHSVEHPTHTPKGLR